MVGRDVGGGSNRSDIASGGILLLELYSVEKLEGSEVSSGASSEARLWVWDLVAEILVYLQKIPKDFFGPGALFCFSGLILVEGVRGGLSLAGF